MYVLDCTDDLKDKYSISSFQDGNTPLHAAACNKPAKPGVIQSLLQHGAHFDLVNNDKKTFFNLLKGTPLHEVN